MNPKQAKRELERLKKIDEDRHMRELAEDETMLSLGLNRDHIGLNVARWHLRNGSKINQSKQRPIARLNALCGEKWVNDSPMFRRLRAVAFGTYPSTTDDIVKFELAHGQKWAYFDNDESLVWNRRLGLAEVAIENEVFN